MLPTGPRGGGDKLYKLRQFTESVVIKQDTIKQGCIEMHPFWSFKQIHSVMIKNEDV